MCIETEKSYIQYVAHMLDAAMCNKCLISINEDKESKNMHKARKYIEHMHPDVIGQKFQNGTIITSQKLIEEIRNTIPNVRMCNCKFLLGMTRLYFDLQTDNEIQNKFNKLNKMLKIICTAHEDEYDNNLNDLTFDELDKKFSGAVKKELNADKEEINKLELLQKADYDIVPINSFEEAQKYGKYVAWCITHYQNLFNSYTKQGLGRFYFCLKPGFETIKKEKGENCPLDEYGKSMFAISVNDDGSLNTCTCRWNHDNNANDNMMDTKEISKFFGVNFYKTFVPYPADKLLKQYEKIKIDDDDICKHFGCIRCKTETEKNIYVFKKNNQIYTRLSIAPNCVIENKKFLYFKDGKFVKDAPAKINGDFNISDTDIDSLVGAPKEVTGDFNCNNTNITSLEGAPRIVGGKFSCSFTNITSFKGAPTKVGKEFICFVDNTQATFTSLEGMPLEVGEGLDLRHIKLMSLNGAPRKIGEKTSNLFHSFGDTITTDQINAYIEFLNNPTSEHTDNTGHYKE